MAKTPKSHKSAPASNTSSPTKSEDKDAFLSKIADRFKTVMTKNNVYELLAGAGEIQKVCIQFSIKPGSEDTTNTARTSQASNSGNTPLKKIKICDLNVVMEKSYDSTSEDEEVNEKSEFEAEVENESFEETTRVLRNTLPPVAAEPPAVTAESKQSEKKKIVIVKEKNLGKSRTSDAVSDSHDNGESVECEVSGSTKNGYKTRPKKPVSYRDDFYNMKAEQDKKRKMKSSGGKATIPLKVNTTSLFSTVRAGSSNALNSKTNRSKMEALLKRMLLPRT